MIIAELQNDIGAPQKKKRHVGQARRLMAWHDKDQIAHHYLYSLTKPVLYVDPDLNNSRRRDARHVLVSVRMPWDYDRDDGLILSGAWCMTIQPCRETGELLRCVPLYYFGLLYPVRCASLKDADPDKMLWRMGYKVYGD